MRKMGIFRTLTVGLWCAAGGNILLAAPPAVLAVTPPAASTLADILPDPLRVSSVLEAAPEAAAARALVTAEQAEQMRLQAGPYEWSLRLGGQQRRSTPANASGERFNEWNSALERPLRLPGKAGLDRQLGEAGVAQAEVARDDARHELARSLLQAWFATVREQRGAAIWQDQQALLAQQAKGVARRVQLGDAARLEAVQIEAALAQVEAQHAQAIHRRDLAEAALQRRFPGLGLPATAALPAPQALSGDLESWFAALLAHNHELMLAGRQRERVVLQAERARRERVPDPAIGLAFSRERGGEEQVVGAYISIPLPGGARSATADAAQARAAAAERDEAAVRRRIEADAQARFMTAQAAVPAWQAAARSAQQLQRSAEMLGRAYALGEGALAEVLQARRLAVEARLGAEQLQLDALEAQARLLLDAHRLWADD